MKTFFTFLLCLLAVVGESASVLWNEGVFLEGEVSSDRGTWWLRYEWVDEARNVDIYNSICFLIDPATVTFKRKLYGYAADVARECRIISADEGDVVDQNAVSDNSKLVWVNSAEGLIEDLAEFEYRSAQKWTLFLGFESIPICTSGEWYEYYENGFRVYGWIELFVDNYTLSLGRSCIDLSGRPVVVGVRSAEPVPEPATGLLAFLGAAMLFRRGIRRQPHETQQGDY